MGRVVPRSPALQADSLPAEPLGKRIQTGWACKCCHLKSVNEAGPVNSLLTESTNRTFPPKILTKPVSLTLLCSSICLYLEVSGLCR